MSDSVVPTDTFLDRWGHFILWMGPYILIVSLIAWTPRFALLLAGIELLQFTLHVREHHSTHPMTPISALPAAVAYLMIVGGAMVYPVSFYTFGLLVVQVLFSRAVHAFNHGKWWSFVGIWILTAITIGLVKLAVLSGETPGIHTALHELAPRSYLTSG